MTADLHESVEARLRGGVRYTHARQQLIAVLAGAGRPLTADEIAAAKPDLPKSSVYRNLAMFEETGVVRRLAGSGEYARYELAESLVGHHHHLSCSSCGAMTDVELPPRLEAQLEKAFDAIAAGNGFELDAHHLDLIGLCRDCAGRRGRAAQA
jgi:Fur family transcriptional regulator, ferric uptake regulator